jgi:hypothetical protein
MQPAKDKEAVFIKEGALGFAHQSEMYILEEEIDEYSLL